MIRNTLKQYLDYIDEAYHEKRPEHLSVEDFKKICTKIENGKSICYFQEIQQNTLQAQTIHPIPKISPEQDFQICPYCNAQVLGHFKFCNTILFS